MDFGIDVVEIGVSDEVEDEIDNSLSVSNSGSSFFFIVIVI